MGGFAVNGNDHLAGAWNIRTKIQCPPSRARRDDSAASLRWPFGRAGSCAWPPGAGRSPQPMKSLNLQLRFLLPLVVTLVAAAYLALPLIDRVTLRWFARDLNSRGALVANALSDSVVGGAERRQGCRALQALFDRAVQDERLFAIGLCTLDGPMLQRTRELSAHACDCRQAAGARPSSPTRACALAGRRRSTSACITRRRRDAGRSRRLVLLHDLSFIDRRSQDTRRYLVGLIAALGLVIALITMVVAQLSWRGWVSGVRALLRGEGLLRPMVAPTPETGAVRGRVCARACATSRTSTAARRARRRTGTPSACARCCARSCAATRSSSSPTASPTSTSAGRTASSSGGPASGLVTAVEPVMRACSGTWIAHGSGSADREVVDAHDRVAVPPGADDYALRRVWLTRRGGAGLLLRLRQRRPVAAVPRGARAAGVPRVGLGAVPGRQPALRRRRRGRGAQRGSDRAGAGLPLRAAAGDDPREAAARHHPHLLAHPLAEPESFGICPWRREILQGMLGSTILGFHTRFHCKNFIETVDRFLEARIEHEHSTISFQRGRDAGRGLPDLDRVADRATDRRAWPPVAECRRERAASGWACRADACLAVGVDRFDYTKGILERLQRGRAPAREAPGVDRPLRLRAGGGADAQRARGVPHVPGARRSASPSASTSASAGPATSRCTCSRSTTSTTP